MDEDLQAILAMQVAALDVDAMEVAATRAQQVEVPSEAPREPLVPDPRLVAMVHGRFRPEIVRTHALPLYVRELPFHLDPADWRAGFLEVSEGGPPMDVREGLREAVPQAQLRDLFRPEYSKEPVSLDLIELPLDPGARRAFAELRGQQQLEPIPYIPRSIDAIDERIVEHRAFVDEQWQPMLDDAEPRREVYVVIEPSLTG